MTDHSPMGQSVCRPPVFDLYIPERGHRRPFRSILDRPDRLFVAWHRDCKGIHELLDQNGRASWGEPQERLWQVREYACAVRGETAAWYEEVSVNA